MSNANAPIARRYWFADAEALAAIRNAEDAPNWEESNLSTTIFCLDEETHEAMEQSAGEGAVRIVDLRDAQSFGSVLHAELGRERAGYLQFAFHAVEDFAPALELMCERLEQLETQAVRTAMLPVATFGVAEPPNDGSRIPECHWIETGYLRKALAGADIQTLSDLQEHMIAAIGSAPCDEFKLITGAYYLTRSEQPVLNDAELEAATWRARAATAWTEIERLKSERRVRAGREDALKARHKRDLTRQAERTRQEIDRLYRAAGSANWWRSRFARLFGRR